MPRNRPALLAVLVAVVVLAPVTHVAAAPTTTPTVGSVGPPGATGPSAALETATPPVYGPPPNLTAPAADGSAESVLASQSEANTSNFLSLRTEAVEQRDMSRASLNVAGAIQRDVTRLENEYSALTFAERYENTTSHRARMDVVRLEVRRLTRSVQQLEIRRNRVLDAYNDGDIGVEMFHRELVALDAAARGIEIRLERIRDTTGPTLTSDLSTEMRNLEGSLLTLRGPVRQQLAAAMTGTRAPIQVYTVTSGTGIVLASNEGPLYYREAYLGQNRRVTGENNFISDGDPSGVSTANTRATELYPWVYDNIRSGPNVEIVGNTSIYYVQLGHPHGSLDTYLDGRTDSTFREIQVKNLPSLPTRTTTNVSNGLELTVNRTHATGPMSVSVSDSATGGPLDATVTVNGNEVGDTGSDGQLWTITPQQSVRISVTTDDGRTVTKRFFAG